MLPRGSIKMLLNELMKDDGTLARELLADPNPCLRVRLGRSLLKAADNPKQVGYLLGAIGDRLEGMPTKTVITQKQHVTYIVEEGKPLPPELQPMFGDKPSAVLPQPIAAGGPVRTDDGYEEVTGD